LRLPLAVVAALLATGAIVGMDLDASQRSVLATMFTGPRLGLIALLLLPALALFVWHMYRRTAATRDAALRIAESTGLIARSNPAHRVAALGTAELCAVATAVNELAQQRADLMADVQAAVDQAKAGLEEERNRFAALISELDQSVLVCNRDGRILLYNAAVSALLDPEGKKGADQSLGLGALRVCHYRSQSDTACCRSDRRPGRARRARKRAICHGLPGRPPTAGECGARF
jgi:DNA polymerase III subunit epsilon